MRTIRRAEPADRDAILEVVDRAFTGPDHDGGDEVHIVLDTWRLGAGIEGLELVAEDDGVLVGYILGARGRVGGRDVAAIAPVAVAPPHQRRGVGADLVTELLRQADVQGWPVAVVLGDPLYYSRFGFEAAGPLGLVYGPAGKGDPRFQARRLRAYDPALRGEVRYCWEADAR